jgi:SpoU rRNA methylase family enzyme
MNIKIHETGSQKIAEVISESVVLNDLDDTLDLIAGSGMLDASSIILYKDQISPDFFDLSTRLAGEILQKFSNYRLQLAVIGDFSKYSSKSLRDFINECNRGNRIIFVPDLVDAINRLSRG